MKVFITNIEDKGEQEALLDGTCDICFEWATTRSTSSHSA